MSSLSVITLPHFEQLGTVLLSQFAVEHTDCSLQVSPLRSYFLLSLLQLFHLFLFLRPQSLHLLILLLIQEAMEVLKLSTDFPFQVIEPVLKDKWQMCCSSNSLYL